MPATYRIFARHNWNYKFGEANVNPATCAATYPITIDYDKQLIIEVDGVEIRNISEVSTIQPGFLSFPNPAELGHAGSTNGMGILTEFNNGANSVVTGELTYDSSISWDLTTALPPCNGTTTIAPPNPNAGGP